MSDRQRAVRRFQAFEDGEGPLLPLHEQDATGFLRTLVGALEEPAATAVPAFLDRAIKVLGALVDVSPAEWRFRSLALVTLSDALSDRHQLTGRIEDSDACLAAMRRAAEIDDGQEYARVMLAARTGTAVCARYEHTGDRGALDEAVQTLRPVAGTAADAEYGHLALSALAEVLLHRCRAGGGREDADEAVRTYRRVVNATPTGVPNWAARTSNLAMALLERHRRYGDAADVQESVARQADAVEATPLESPLRASRLARLGDALYAGYATEDGQHGQQGDPDLLHMALSALRSAVPALPPSAPYYRTYAGTLAQALVAAYHLTGDPGLLDEQVTLYDDVQRRTDADADAVWRAFIEPVADAHLKLYERTGDCVHLDRAATSLHAAVDSLGSGDSGEIEDWPDDGVGVPDHGTFRASGWALYGQVLRMRCEHTGDLEDANAAVRAHRSALAETPPGHKGHPALQSALGLTLCSRYEVTGSVRDLNEAVDLLGSALANLPDGDPRRPGIHSDYGLVLAFRYHVSGAISDLDEAIQAHREAVAFTVPTTVSGARDGANGEPLLPRPSFADRLERGRRLLNLAGPLRQRFEHNGRLSDLNEAIAALEGAAMEGARPAAERHLVLRDLGWARIQRAQRTHARTDAESAVDALRGALDAVPSDHFERARCMAELAAGLIRRSRHGDPSADLAEAVSLGREALATLPAVYPRAHHVCVVAAQALYGRFQHGGDEGDLAEARATLAQSLDTLPPDHSQRPGILLHLGHLWATGPRAEPGRAVGTYRTVAAMKTGPAYLRCEAARWWGKIAAADGDWATALDGFSAALELLPLAGARGIAREDQEFQLAAFRGIASDAAACAVRCGYPELALQLLEQGRGILLARALETRGGIAGLAKLDGQHPDLARRFLELRTSLDAAPNSSTELGFPPADAPPHQTAVDHLDRVARECDELIEEIRQLPGFEDFLLPPQIGDLTPLAAQGPVVALNTSPYGCCALILTTEGVQAQPLDGLDLDRLQELTAQSLAAVEGSNASDASYAVRLTAMEKVSEVLAWLWDTVTEPVLTRLTELGLAGDPPSGAAAGAWPRVWWMPTGLLSFLPVHAAGRHGERRSVLDRVVSSYTPTLHALRHARERPRSAPGRAVVVAVPDPPGLPALTASEREAAAATAALPGAVLRLDGTQATPERVTAALADASFVHIASHAVSDLRDLSGSHLVLADGATLTVAQLAGHDRAGGQLAYLSACSTARSGVALVDESVHIASAFQLAGYRHVLAALWPLGDDFACRLAEEAYRRGVVRDPAYALHEAVRALRAEDPGALVSWVSPVHTGP